ncbi:hypothetical protein Ancab_036943 [Ancistrocladus abbreviatus]
MQRLKVSANWIQLRSCNNPSAMTPQEIGRSQSHGLHSVQIYRGIIYSKEMQKPTRTFVDWYILNPITIVTRTEYVHFGIQYSWCWWKMADPAKVDRVQVFKKPNSHLWNKV